MAKLHPIIGTSLLAIICTLLVSFILVPNAYAQKAETPSSTGYNCDKFNEDVNEFVGAGEKPNEVLSKNCYNAGGLINQAVKIAFIIAALIAVLFIIIGGFRYITSAGNEERAKSGRKILIWAIIGLAVIILAATIVTIVNRLITTGT